MNEKREKKPEKKAEIDRREFLRAGAAATLALSLAGAGCDDAEGEPVAQDGAVTLPPDAGADAGSPDAGSPDTGPSDAGPGTAADRPQDDERFPTAALAGAMTATGALIRGQTTEAEAVLRIWPEDAPAEVAFEARVAAADGYLLATAEGLQPGTRYAFAFLQDPADDGPGARSPIGRFRTAPAADARPALTIGATACTNRRQSPYHSLSLLARQEMDVFCHLGDMSYNDDSRSVDDFRALWGFTLREAGYRAVFGRVGMYQTWDDHEIANNDELYTLPREVITAGRQAFFEALPTPEGPNGELWRSYRWGATAEIFVLDCRLERQPETRETPDAIYISRAQMDWLKQALVDSPCHFKILLNSVPITHFPWPAEADRWQGYAAQREELLDHLHDAGLDNVWFLSGDLHLGCVARVEPPGGARRNRWEILCGHGASFGNPLAYAASRSEAQRDRYLPANQFVHFNIQFAATTLTFDPADDSVRVRFLDAATEEVLYDEVLRESEA